MAEDHQLHNIKILQPAAMSKQERDVIEKKFIQSAERREPKVILQSSLFVRKQGE